MSTHVVNIDSNHIYIGNEDYLLKWSNFQSNDESREQLNDEEYKKLTDRVRNLIKNYLQLDNVNFLFGTGSSIHLGAVSIQNIPREVEEDINKPDNWSIQYDFENYVKRLQKAILNSCKITKDVPFKDKRGWKLIYDGTYIRNYIDVEEDGGNIQNHYGEICLMFEELLNYLIAVLYQKEAENEPNEAKHVRDLINFLKKSLFNLCDVHGRQTTSRDLSRIKEKGFESAFSNNKYIFHEKFLKSLMQRPINLQRANIFTSNYDLAFEYAFDNLGIKYIDGFSGFHHRYFKPETFDYDIFYPGTTTAGKVQRIEKVVRYFKLHGSISWVGSDVRTANNIYGIEEMPIELIKMKANEGTVFNYGNVIIYPCAVKKSYTLDLPYSELFRQFAYCTSKPQSVLFTIGYSFCDEHFNDIIYQALSNPSFTLIIVDFNGTSRSAEMKRLRDLNDPRIIILEGNYLGDFLSFSDTLMPDFFEVSSNDKIADTLNQLIKFNQE